MNINAKIDNFKQLTPNLTIAWTIDVKIWSSQTIDAKIWPLHCKQLTPNRTIAWTNGAKIWSLQTIRLSLRNQIIWYFYRSVPGTSQLACLPGRWIDNFSLAFAFCICISYCISYCIFYCICISYCICITTGCCRPCSRMYLCGEACRGHAFHHPGSGLYLHICVFAYLCICVFVYLCLCICIICLSQHHIYCICVFECARLVFLSYKN